MKKLSLPKDRADHLLNRLAVYIDNTRREMNYLEDAIKEIKQELKIQKKK